MLRFKLTATILAGMRIFTSFYKLYISNFHSFMTIGYEIGMFDLLIRVRSTSKVITSITMKAIPLFFGLMGKSSNNPSRSGWSGRECQSDSY